MVSRTHRPSESPIGGYPRPLRGRQTRGRALGSQSGSKGSRLPVLEPSRAENPPATSYRDRPDLEHLALLAALRREQPNSHRCSPFLEGRDRTGAETTSLTHPVIMPPPGGGSLPPGPVSATGRCCRRASVRVWGIRAGPDGTAMRSGCAARPSSGSRPGAPAVRLPTPRSDKQQWGAAPPHDPRAAAAGRAAAPAAEWRGSG